MIRRFTLVPFLCAACLASSATPLSPQAPVPAPRPAQPPLAARKRAPAKPRPKAARPDPATQVELNSATREQLEALPGITEALANQIIQARPFLTKARLNNHLLPPGLYEGLRDQVRVVPPDMATILKSRQAAKAH